MISYWVVGWLVGYLVTQSVILLIEAAGSHTCCMEDTLYSLWWCREHLLFPR